VGLMKRFLANSKGNTSIMVAVALVPMLAVAGAAVDMVQTNRAKSVLQGAADAAVLAGASSKILDEVALTKIVEDFVDANGASHVLDNVDAIIPKLDKVKRTFSVKITGKRKTSLMYLAGISEMELNAYAEVKLGGDGLEVALVLDNTGSMLDAGRLPALKVAAKQLVNDLLETAKTGAYVRVGIVPFADYVNVGLSRRSQPWLDVDNDATVTTNGCWDTYPNATKSNCKQVPAFADGVALGYTYEQCDWNYGTPVKVCGPQTSTTTWYGCVGSRNDPLDASIGTPATRYRGLSNVGCTSEIQVLTNSKAKLDAKIDSLVATGNTYIPPGLLWGWNMLDSNQPLTEAKTASAMDAMGGSKALVLMTDGANTLSADPPYHWGNDVAKANAKTAALCANIKADKITVYTVAFMVTDPTAKNLLSDCASDPSKVFTADSATQLAKAFAEIGNSLTAMRLTK
jgi:Flp pilus assembly protein TadG